MRGEELNMEVFELLLVCFVVVALFVFCFFSALKENKRLQIEHEKRVRFFDDLHEQKENIKHIDKAISYYVDWKRGLG